MKITNISEDEILFSNGSRLTFDHVQGCCEHVYAEFRALLDTPAMSFEFSDNPPIEVVDGSGFRIEGWFVPCYNVQNGYYSSNLTLYFGTPDKNVLAVDLTAATQFVER